MKALAVVPPAVKLRVAVLVTLGVLVWASLGVLGWALPAVRAVLWGVQAALLVLGAYVGWCLWPRVRTGIGPALHGELERPAAQTVRLSFDDGPTPGVTDAILDVLQAEGVRASFFVLSPKARAHPALIRRMVAEGHTVGLHGEDHRAPFFRSSADLGGALARARAELAAIAGQPIDLYRPSHGWKNLALLRAVRTLGLRVCFWDYGVWDTDAPPRDVLLTRLRAITPAAPLPPHAPGPVVLLHDGRGDEPGAPPHAQVMLAALRAWLPAVRAA